MNAFEDESKIWVYKQDGMWIIDIAATQWDDCAMHEHASFAAAMAELNGGSHE